jgi:hypothetical protein
VKKVISTALFGSAGYNLEPVIASALTFFPGWEFRIHHDIGLLSRQPKLKWYADKGLIVLKEVGINLYKGKSMLWRMLPMWDRTVDYFLCRDLDSLLLVKDRRMVETFIASKAAAHCVNDHPDHCVPMMGGMIGFWRYAWNKLPGSTLYPDFEHLTEVQDGFWNQYGADQYLMWQKLWPIAQQSVCEHRLAGWAPIPGTVHSSAVVEPHPLPDVDPHFLEEVDHPYHKKPCARGDSYANFMGAPQFTDQAMLDFRQWGPPAVLTL